MEIFFLGLKTLIMEKIKKKNKRLVCVCVCLDVKCASQSHLFQALVFDCWVLFGEVVEPLRDGTLLEEVDH